MQNISLIQQLFYDFITFKTIDFSVYNFLILTRFFNQNKPYNVHIVRLIDE